MFSFAHREAMRKGSTSLVCLFSPPVLPCSVMPQYEHILLFHYCLCSAEFSWLLYWQGFSGRGQGLPQWTIRDRALSVSCVCWCASSQPAGWYNLCNYPQIYLLHNGGVSCFVGCGSRCSPGPGQCWGPLALCWLCAGGRSLLISLLGHCFSCPVTGAQSAGLCPSLGTTLVPSAAPVPIYSSISICACLRCTSIPLRLLLLQ